MSGFLAAKKPQATEEILQNRKTLKTVCRIFFRINGVLILFRMGFFGAAHGWVGGWVGGAKSPPSLKSVTHILR